MMAGTRYGPVPNLVDDCRFRSREAVWRIAGTAGTNERLCIIFALPWILDDTVRDPIDGVTRGDCGGGDRRKLCCGDWSAELLVHCDLRPELGWNEAIPVEGRRACE